MNVVDALHLVSANAAASKIHLGVKRHWQVHRVVTPAVVGSSPTAPVLLPLSSVG